MTAPSPAHERHWWDKLSPLTEAQRDIIASCAPLLHKFVNADVSRHGLDYDHAYDEALRGLIHGSLRFDSRRGVKWSTYACGCIRGRLRRVICDHYKAAQGRRVFQFSLDHKGDSFIEDNVPAPVEAPEIDIDEALALLLRHLPAHLQTVVRHRLCGLTYPVIATILGISRQRAHQMQMSALEKMREVARRTGMTGQVIEPRRAGACGGVARVVA